MHEYASSLRFWKVASVQIIRCSYIAAACMTIDVLQMAHFATFTLDFLHLRTHVTPQGTQGGFDINVYIPISTICLSLCRVAFGYDTSAFHQVTGCNKKWTPSLTDLSPFR